MLMLRTDDVIAAVSSPAGRAARGIVRLTGPGAIASAAAVFAPADGRSLAAQQAWRVIPGRLQLRQNAAACSAAERVEIAAPSSAQPPPGVAGPAGLALPCNVVLFRPPRSYTGQELVEFHLPGSPAVLEIVLRAVTAAGARLAGPGEFTARAFFSGRLDLVSAEAVQERIAATSDAHLAAAQQLASGALAERIGGATDELTDLLSLVEAGIDFADEPIEFIDAASLRQRLASLEASLQDLLARSIEMQRLEALPRVALVGPMSAGKSSLVNRLSGLDRSICSPIPGTTRDVLSAVMDTPGGQVLLLDGPGLGAPRSDLDRLAQDAWRGLLSQVDLALIVLPADSLYHDAFADAADAALDAVHGRPHLFVLNKMDLVDSTQRARLEAVVATLAAGMELPPEHRDGVGASGTPANRTGVPAEEQADMAGSTGVHMISAATGAGCDDLRSAIGMAVSGRSTSSQGRIVLTARHGDALATSLEEIRAARELLSAEGGDPPAELIALHLREAVTQLGQVTGAVTTEDLLERVFSRFCIGK